MRIPAVLAVSVLLSTPTVYAQDLQFRTVATSEALGLSLPGFTMNVAIKGQLTRVDIDVAGMWFSSIVDYGAKKMLMINHEEMSYTERAHAGPRAVVSESRPELRETGETRQLAGLKVKRVLLTSNVPSAAGPEEGRRAVTVQEMWVASDARLAEAFMRYLSAMAASGKANASSPLFGDIPPGTFPVRITVVILTVRPDEKVDVDAVLQGRIPAEQVQMRMVMETSDIQRTEIDASHFVVPTGYVKSSKQQ